jgi:hypothetical protein
MVANRFGAMRYELPILPAACEVCGALLRSKLPAAIWAPDGDGALLGLSDEADGDPLWILSISPVANAATWAVLWVYPCGEAEALKVVLLLAWFYPAIAIPLEYIVSVLDPETGGEVDDHPEAYAGTDDKVWAAHKMLKSGDVKQCRVWRTLRIDARTYQRHCFRVTGEDPILGRRF